MAIVIIDIRLIDPDRTYTWGQVYTHFQRTLSPSLGGLLSQYLESQEPEETDAVQGQGLREVWFGALGSLCQGDTGPGLEHALNSLWLVYFAIGLVEVRQFS